MPRQKYFCRSCGREIEHFGEALSYCSVHCDVLAYYQRKDDKKEHWVSRLVKFIGMIGPGIHRNQRVEVGAEIEALSQKVRLAS